MILLIFVLACMYPLRYPTRTRSFNHLLTTHSPLSSLPLQIRDESTAAPFDARVTTLVTALQQWLGDRGRPPLSSEESKKSGLESVQQWAQQQSWLNDHQWQWSPYGDDQEGKGGVSKGEKPQQTSGMGLSRVLDEPGAMEVLAHVVLNGEADVTISPEVTMTMATPLPPPPLPWLITIYQPSDPSSPHTPSP